jgi:polysaccharide pyruvyl transferase WcaK-like protein
MSVSSPDVLAGYYGFGNFGDDLFRDLLTRAMASRPWAHPMVTQNTPAPLAKATRNLQAIRNILRARSLTLGGGSILGARPPFGIRHIEMAVTSRKKVPYCAIGVGILEGLPDLPHNVISRMSWIGLRSEREYRELKPSYAQVNYTSDLAYAAPSLLLEQARPSLGEAREIAVIPAGVGQLGKSSAEPGQAGRWLAGNVAPFLAAGYRIKILLLQPVDQTDAGLCELYKQEAGKLGAETRLLPHQDATATVREIASSAFVFTDRLHGAIISHICGVPFRLSKHHQKCVDFLADIAHPDADEGISYASDTAGAGVAAVRNWTEGQEEAVRRHEARAVSGIDAWLAHLEERVG